MCHGTINTPLPRTRDLFAAFMSAFGIEAKPFAPTTDSDIIDTRCAHHDTNTEVC